MPTTLFDQLPLDDVLVLKTDCGDEAEVNDAVAKTVERFGRIDYAVFAAGSSGVPGRDTPAEQFDQIMRLNGRGPWLCEKAVLRVMVKQEERSVR